MLQLPGRGGAFLIGGEGLYKIVCRCWMGFSFHMESFIPRGLKTGWSRSVHGCSITFAVRKTAIYEVLVTTPLVLS